MTIAKTILKRLREPRLSDRGESARTTFDRQPGHQCSPGCRTLLNLSRSAERLDRIERLLIARVSSNYDVDAETDTLLRELSLTTNRMRGQILQMQAKGELLDIE